jgi:murein tripeptide amidase MpaA
MAKSASSKAASKAAAKVTSRAAGKARFDTYYRYAELVKLLEDYAAAHPGLMRLSSIGKSHEGRDIWLATITNFSSGEDADKPAFWVDGNIHATEVAASMACLYFIDHLVTKYGKDGEVTACLDSRVFYVCPRLNPDGAELALADVPKFIRSSTRPWPYDDEHVEGLIREDADGDGRVLSMRVRDPNGPWKADTVDPRLLVRRGPVESGGTYYRLLPEGKLLNYDGVTTPVPLVREGLDLNRNFPVRWRPEHEQFGAGPYPTSETEVDAAVRFICLHNNITGAICFHTYSGVLLRPFSDMADEKMAAEDLWTFQKIGAKGTELTDYPNISVFHDFRYHPNDVITGGFDDWAYEMRGVYSWTVEIWSPQRAAGITDYKFVDWFREHPVEDARKLLLWNDQELGGKGFVNWYKFKHPQLGEVEIGGWDSLYTWSNPPKHLLEKEVARFPQWLIWHLMISPRLELLEAKAVKVADGAYRVRLAVQNTGWLPSYVCKKALERKLTRGVICEIELPKGAQLEAGEIRQRKGELEGRAYKTSTPTGWLVLDGDATDDRLKAEWVVRAPKGSVLKLTARHDRAGTVRAEVKL